MTAARVRAVSAGVCLVLACVLAPIAVVAVWAQHTIANTDGYVAAVAPLSDDPAVQAAVERRLTDRIMTAIDQQQPLQKATQDLAESGVPPRLADSLSMLAGPLREATENLVSRAVTKAVESDAFATAWQVGNRTAHREVVGVLSGDSAVLRTTDQTVVLDLGPLVDDVKTQLESSGLTFVARIPDVDATIVIGDGAKLRQAETAYSVLSKAGTVLVVVVLVLIAGGIALARQRRRAIARTGLGVIGAVVLLAVGLAMGRGFALGELPPNSSAAATAVFDSLIHQMRLLSWGVVLVAALVSIAAVVTGPSPRAVTLRARAVGVTEAALSVVESSPWARPVAGAAAVAVVVTLLAVNGLHVLEVLLLLAAGAVATFIALR